uniref:Ig-like domain-containing protein n=1 Tax=Takifugu rubripes TaxID=31033 RepID=A0A674P1L9_TAKRU
MLSTPASLHHVETLILLTFMYPPIFVSKPEPMTLFVGKEAVFQCSLTGSSPMDVVWHKDNIAISSEGNYVMKSDKNKYSLHIKSLELAHQGVYLCKASNSVGTATFTTELWVVDKPSFVKPFDQVSAAVNDPVRLECQVNEDIGVTITWTRDGKKVHQSMDCKLSFEDKLAVIAGLEKADSGVYKCRATNSAGFKETSGTLYVKGYECSAYGRPLCCLGTYFIKKDATSSSLELQSVKPSDSATYTCQVSNDAGKVDCTAVLFVKGACL